MGKEDSRQSIVTSKRGRDIKSPRYLIGRLGLECCSGLCEDLSWLPQSGCIYPAELQEFLSGYGDRSLFLRGQFQISLVWRRSPHLFPQACGGQGVQKDHRWARDYV